jgi:Rrf2 family protein
MIKLNRTTEYGLIALRHMSRKQDAVTSAREIADRYGLPFEITAKTLQRLKDTGLIASAQGARGGYTIRKPLADVNLAEFLELMEGPQAVMACGPQARECGYHERCDIRGVMDGLNQKVREFLSGIRLAELADGRAERVQFLGAGEEP